MNAAELGRMAAASSLLRQAHQVLDPSEDGLLGAAAALVDCASVATAAAAAGDPDAAREALACARAAVVTTTYLARRIADLSRLQPGQPQLLGGPTLFAEIGQSPVETYLFTDQATVPEFVEVAEPGVRSGDV